MPNFWITFFYYSCYFLKLVVMIFLDMYVSTAKGFVRVTQLLTWWSQWNSVQLENFFWLEFRYLAWGILPEEWNCSAFSFRSVPIIHKVEIDTINRAVELIGRPTLVEKKNKFYVAVLKIPWMDDLKPIFI